MERIENSTIEGSNFQRCANATPMYISLFDRGEVPFLLSCVSLVAGQYNSRPYQVTTPVPILKQINKHNGDGSYSYGYEAADGSYKIESKYPTGEVYGKYGFVDDTGSVREIEYGASRRGFEPAGAGINVPPPTLTSANSIANEPEDDGQYREDPSVYYTDPRYTNGERYEPRPPAQSYNLQRRPSVDSRSLPSNSMPIAPRMSAPRYEAAYRPQYQPQYQGQQGQGRSLYTPMAYQAGYQGHPAPNVVSNAGLASYTINYKR
ncbi:LIM domain-binding protein 3-like [Vespula squamosa]|uniref:LIM domain-binding protein 3-like n=1 Tax=Vespula squamosa TaxID=30214 RepID=A0ABD2A3I0_VESSQ